MTLSCSNDVIQIVQYPVTVTVTFSLSVTSVTSNSFTYVNCFPLNTTMISPSVYNVFLVPLMHGTFSITLPANAVTSSGSSNTEVSLYRIYVGGILTTTAGYMGWDWTEVYVAYDYSATIHCMYNTSDVPPSSCYAIQTHSTHVSTEVAAGIRDVIILTNMQLNHTYSVFCCAEEMYGVMMQTLIEDTRLQFSVGWLDCPMMNGLPCSGNGECVNPGWCECSSGYYGSFCNKVCEGLIIHSTGEIEECNGHGQCVRENGYECLCDSHLFSGPGCSLSLMDKEQPSSSNVFVYVGIELISNEEWFSQVTDETVKVQVIEGENRRDL